MKHFIFSLALLSFCAPGYSQTETYELKVDCFSPIFTPSLSMYFNDEWSLSPWDNDGAQYSRKYHSLGYSASVARLHKKAKFGYRFGIVSRSSEESTSMDYKYPGPGGSSTNMSQWFDFKQTHFLNSLFVEKEEKIKFISIHLGAELPFIYYGEGISNYHDHSQYYNNNKLATESYSNSISKTSPGFATGLGFNIGMSYQLSRWMQFGAGMSEYLLYTRFNKPSTISGHTDSYYIENGNEQHIDSKRETTMKLSQWGFSRLTPRVFFAIKL